MIAFIILCAVTETNNRNNVIGSTQRANTDTRFVIKLPELSVLYSPIREQIELLSSEKEVKRTSERASKQTNE